MEPEIKKSLIPLLIIAVAIGLICLAIFWLIYPYKVLTVEEVDVKPQIVRAGDVVFMHTKFCVFTDSPIKVNTDLVGDLVVIQLPPRDIRVTYPQGCDEVDSTRQLPLINNVGKFYFESEAIVKVNPIRTVVVRWRSKDIEIIPAEAEVLP